MIVKEISTASYVQSSKLPTSDYVINPYVGCPHACRYCYASFMKRFTNHPEPWGSFLDVKVCPKKIAVDKLAHKTVFMSSVTDCYNPFEETYRITRSIVEQFVGSDVSLSISTKNKLVLRDLDLFQHIKHLEIAISIHTLDESFKKDMDQASSIKERIEVLRVLHEHGIRTVLFMSPIFPEITEWQEIILQQRILSMNIGWKI